MIQCSGSGSVGPVSLWAPGSGTGIDIFRFHTDACFNFILIVNVLCRLDCWTRSGWRSVISTSPPRYSNFLFEIKVRRESGLRIRITLMLFRIQLFTSVRILIGVLLLIKVMGICNHHWSIGPSGLHFEPPGLHL
jgi:hypothetical protein